MLNLIFIRTFLQGEHYSFSQKLANAFVGAVYVDIKMVPF